MNAQVTAPALAPVPIKPYTTQQLADIFGVSARTIQNWIEPHKAAIGKKRGHFWTARQVKIILKKIGLPGIAKDDD